jgi:undecaprenyl-diphosphatase
MSIFQAVILGIVQGLTEFLPISSSAHLTLVGKAMGLISVERPEAWTAFIAVIQLGTLVAILLCFARDIARISSAFARENLAERRAFSEQSHDSIMGWYVCIGTAPIVAIGLALKRLIESNLTKDVTLIAWTLITLGLALWIAEWTGKQNRTLNDLTWKDALIIGFAQTLALFPGASRSGTTITAGLFIGLQRATAARFSFLLSIPAIFASGVLQAREAFNGSISAEDFLAVAVATVVSGVAGYAAIAFLLRYLQTHSTFVFTAYRVALGVALLTVWKTLFAS